METWLTDAVNSAKEAAESIICDLCWYADRLDVEREWFIEETIKHMHKIESEHYVG